MMQINTKLVGVVKTEISLSDMFRRILSTVFVLLSVPFDESLNCTYDFGNSL